MHLRRVLLWSFLGSLGVTALTGILALLFDLPESDRIIGTAALIAAYSLGGLACAALIARGRSVTTSWITLGILGASMVVWIVLIWFQKYFGYSNVNTVMRIGATVTLAGACALQFAFLRQLNVKWFISNAAWICGCVFAAISATILILIFWEILDEDEGVWRFFGGLLILGALGSFAAPLLAYLERIGRESGAATHVMRAVPVDLTCPSCATSFTAMSDQRKLCPTCKLVVRVQVEELKCGCGYQLQGLAGDRCPECGTPIADSLRKLSEEGANEHQVDR